VCDLHVDRIEKALHHLKHLMPFQEDKIESLKDNELAYLELLTNRFARLQDTLGAKIFPLFLRIIDESRPEDTAIDRLHKLEKFGILNAKEWAQMRDLRNHITHEYPDSPKVTVTNLNKVTTYAHHLIVFWRGLKNRI